MPYSKYPGGSSWADSMGSILRGEQPINQLVPNHPYIDSLPHLEELLAKNTQHIMLFTLAEARGVLSDLTGKADDFFSYTLGGGNIKDILDGMNTVRNFSTYLDEANQLAFNLKGLGIRAKACKYGTETYIKITGYASTRRILNGTRYRANSLQLLELGIGWRGAIYNFARAVRFCVYFSLAFRAIELIFKKEYTLVDFFGDVIMDTAKTLVSTVIATIAGIGLALVSSPLILTAGLIIFLGIYVNYKLNKLDKENGWSQAFKKMIREALIDEIKMQEWNKQHMSPDALVYFNKNYY
ncbi:MULTISPECIES: hypothetical protein [Enterobacterales]|uniref:hypothetical protein n=1 Tax=Enterobacterales TaxID=91347 RepID=UPI002EDAE94E